MKKVLKKYFFFLIFLLIIFNLGYGNTLSLDKIKKDIVKIDNEIADKNTKIKTIESEKVSLETQIEENEKEIKEIKEERKKILEEIRKVSRNIDYSEKSLNFSSDELVRTKKDIDAKLILWNRYSIEKAQIEILDEERLGIKNLLNSNFNKIGKVKNVQSDIKIVKSDIEKDKKELDNLQYRSYLNAKKLDSKISQQEQLIKKLNAQKLGYQSDIKKLNLAKEKMEKEIKRIIQSRAKKIDKKINFKSAKTKLGRISKPTKGTIVTKYGQKKNGITSNGIEIRNELGAEVIAAGDGKVIYSDDFQGLGKVVMIEYGYNLIGVYGNLISTNVKLGEKVNKTQVIGILGYSNDGNPDLYYELRFNLKPTDPEEFF